MDLIEVIGGLMSARSRHDARCCGVVELRQYTFKPQQRDVLIDLFDRHFVESQEAVGMKVVGQFRDRGNPDRFVWLRGFPDMPARHKALEAFYDGPVWAAHKARANDTMVDSDDVLLLRPARPDLAFQLDALGPESISRGIGPATVLAGIHQIPRGGSDVVSLFEAQVLPQFRANCLRLLGVFITESALNTFTRLPVREGERVLVWFGLVEGAQVTSVSLDRMKAPGNWPALLLELEPTSRSIMGGGRDAARATKHDFDFLHGSWKIRNQYLKERLRHSTEWLEFEAHSEVMPLLDGFGHLDRYSAVRDGAAFEGITLRLFDPETGQWSIHWADTLRARTLLPPMTGRFLGGVGEFHGEENVRGVKVLCRFRWTRPGVDVARWEQAFSEDGGKTWEANWIMTFIRP
ncbi:MAG TPA: NIPSNAP family protein [Vicinamibacterales bacterium]|nr:NIPSNAP family protein [Vicinamibacterales bacterium]